MSVPTTQGDQTSAGRFEPAPTSTDSPKLRLAAESLTASIPGVESASKSRVTAGSKYDDDDYDDYDDDYDNDIRVNSGEDGAFKEGGADEVLEVDEEGNEIGVSAPEIKASSLVAGNDDADDYGSEGFDEEYGDDEFD